MLLILTKLLHFFALMLLLSYLITSCFCADLEPFLPKPQEQEALTPTDRPLTETNHSMAFYGRPVQLLSPSEPSGIIWGESEVPAKSLGRIEQSTHPKTICTITPQLTKLLGAKVQQSDISQIICYVDHFLRNDPLILEALKELDTTIRNFCLAEDLTIREFPDIKYGGFRQGIFPIYQSIDYDKKYLFKIIEILERALNRKLQKHGINRSAPNENPILYVLGTIYEKPGLKIITDHLRKGILFAEAIINDIDTMFHGTHTHLIQMYIYCKIFESRDRYMEPIELIRKATWGPIYGLLFEQHDAQYNFCFNGCVKKHYNLRDPFNLMSYMLCDSEHFLYLSNILRYIYMANGFSSKITDPMNQREYLKTGDFGDVRALYGDVSIIWASSTHSNCVIYQIVSPQNPDYAKDFQRLDIDIDK